MRTIAAVTRDGLARAWRARRLILVVWLIHLVLAGVAAFPLWRTLDSVLGSLPEADVLRAGIVFGAIFDLAEMRPGLMGTFGFTLAAVAVLGVLVGAAVTGGVLEVLRGGDERSLGHRFGRGAGRFFGRFAGAVVVVGLVAGATGVLGVLPFVALARRHYQAGLETWRLATLVGALAGGLVILLALLVLDASRIHIVRSDAGLRAGLRAGFGLVLRHPLLWAGTWLLNATLVGVALALFVLFREAVSTDRGALILAMVLAQQTLMVVRTGLRVALLASEGALAERLRPHVPPVTVPAPPQPASSSPSPAVV